MGASRYTGDDVVDRILRVIIDRVSQRSAARKQDLRDGVAKEFFTYRGFAFLGGIPLEQVVPAIERLERDGYIRVDYGNRQYGCDISLRPRFPEAA